MGKTKNLALISEIVIVAVILAIVLHWIFQGIYGAKPTPLAYITLIALMVVAAVRRGFFLLWVTFQSGFRWPKIVETHWQSLVLQEKQEQEKRKSKRGPARSQRYSQLIFMALALWLYTLKLDLLFFEYGASLLWISRAVNFFGLLKAGCLFWFLLALHLFCRSFYLDELRAELR